jgi:hypothetical protein
MEDKLYWVLSKFSTSLKIQPNFFGERFSLQRRLYLARFHDVERAQSARWLRHVALTSESQLWFKLMKNKFRRFPIQNYLKMSQCVSKEEME